jgi:D-alanyl-D-alanine carboxypeptidase
MLPSGNDAAICLARWGGNILRSRAEEKKGIKKIPKIKRFVNHMNKLSHDLCLEDTKFDNVHGLSNS